MLVAPLLYYFPQVFIRGHPLQISKTKGAGTREVKGHQGGIRVLLATPHVWKCCYGRPPDAQKLQALKTESAFWHDGSSLNRMGSQS